MKKTMLTIAAILVCGVISFFAINGTKAPIEESPRDPVMVSSQVAYLSDLEKHIAMFVVPVNYSTNGHWTAFDMKASTNNFNRNAAKPRGVSDNTEDVLFYCQSGDANIGTDVCDRMKIFVCNFENQHNHDYRSYCYITNTTDYTQWFDNAIVLIDLECLVRNPETDETGNSKWLSNLNENLTWVYSRSGNNGREMNPHVDRVSLWKPIQPVCWFKKMPNWGGTFEQLGQEPIVSQE